MDVGRFGYLPRAARSFTDRWAPDRHTRYFIRQLAERYLRLTLFPQILGRIQSTHGAPDVRHTTATEGASQYAR